MYRLAFLLLSFFVFSKAHIDDEVLYDFEKRCMVCHDTYEKTEMAPPIIAIHRIYKDRTKNDIKKSEKMIVDFLSEPSKEKGLMKPAMKLFGVMPKQELTQEQMQNFSEVIMELEYEQPEWFEKHYKSHKLNLEHEDQNEIDKGMEQ